MHLGREATCHQQGFEAVPLGRDPRGEGPGPVGAVAPISEQEDAWPPSLDLGLRTLEKQGGGHGIIGRQCIHDEDLPITPPQAPDGEGAAVRLEGTHGRHGSLRCDAHLQGDGQGHTGILGHAGSRAFHRLGKDGLGPPDLSHCGQRGKNRRIACHHQASHWDAIGEGCQGLCGGPLLCRMVGPGVGDHQDGRAEKGRGGRLGLGRDRHALHHEDFGALECGPEEGIALFPYIGSTEPPEALLCAVRENEASLGARGLRQGAEPSTPEDRGQQAGRLGLAPGSVYVHHEAKAAAGPGEQCGFRQEKGSIKEHRPDGGQAEWLQARRRLQAQGAQRKGSNLLVASSS